MTPERARELLGGLATGILTPEERQTLFEAALHDQMLFNEVADELEFAAFLQSPETRAQLVNRIPEVEPVRRPWWALRPAWLALTGALAASAVLFVAVWNHQSAQRPAGGPVEVSAPATPPPPADAPESLKTETAAKPKLAANTPGKPAPGNQAAGKQAASKDAPIKQAESKEKVAVADKAAEPVVAAPLASANPPSPAPAPRSMAPQTARGGGTSILPRAADSQETARKDERAAPAPAVPSTTAPPEARNKVPMAAPTPPPAALLGGTSVATGSVEGTVRDTSGAPVARAAVDVVSASGSAAHTESDASGKFAVQSLPPGGPYTVTAQAPGFRREQKTGITLSANQPARVDLPLQLGDVSQTVEVTATAGLIQNFNPVQQVAVLDFVNSPGQGQSGQQAADLLSRQLLDGGQVRVIDRETVQRAWQSQGQKAQSQDGKTRQPNAKQVAAFARTIGADAVIVGTVQGSEPPRVFSAVDQQSPNVAVTAEVIDTKKARSTGRVAVTAASLKGATNQLGIAIESKLSPPLQGTVTRVDGDTITVAVTAPGQPRIGTHLSVYRGNRKIGELTLTTAYGQSAVGKFAGGGQPRNGDRVASVR